jgi:hypothetical protein
MYKLRVRIYTSHMHSMFIIATLMICLSLCSVKYIRHSEKRSIYKSVLRRCIRKSPDWPPGARTANGRALCH